MRSVALVSQGKDLSTDLCSTQGEVEEVRGAPSTESYFSDVKISDSLSMSKLTVGTILVNYGFSSLLKQYI